MSDVRWVTTESGHTFLRSGEWTLDPTDGDTPERLRADAAALTAAAEFLEQQAGFDRAQGYAHARMTVNRTPLKPYMPLPDSVVVNVPEDLLKPHVPTPAQFSFIQNMSLEAKRLLGNLRSRNGCTVHNCPNDDDAVLSYGTPDAMCVTHAAEHGRIVLKRRKNGSIYIDGNQRYAGYAYARRRP